MIELYKSSGFPKTREALERRKISENAHLSNDCRATVPFVPPHPFLIKKIYEEILIDSPWSVDPSVDPNSTRNSMLRGSPC
jgi:hypothetical protein